MAKLSTKVSNNLIGISGYSGTTAPVQMFGSSSTKTIIKKIDEETGEETISYVADGEWSSVKSE